MAGFEITHERRIRWLKKAWTLSGGKAWEPPVPNHPLIADAIQEGYLRRVDGRCGFERMRDAMVTWTESGRSAMAANVSVDS